MVGGDDGSARSDGLIRSLSDHGRDSLQVCRRTSWADISPSRCTLPRSPTTTGKIERFHRTPAAYAEEPPEVFTIVEHDVTLASESFPDDACGPRAVTETVTNKTQVNHLTARADGSFHFVDFETGSLFADYVDPTIPDQTFRRTNTEVFNLTPGGTFTQTETLQQFDATLRITSRLHLTVVDGEPKVEREVFIVRGCP